MQTLPAFLQPYLPSYDLTKLDLQDAHIRNEILTQLLNEGNTKAIRWVFTTFAEEDIKKILIHPQKGVWFKESLNYWTKILQVSLEKQLQQQAICDITPQTYANAS